MRAALSPGELRARESFAALAAVPPYAVRLDGRAFHALAEELGWEQPFDERAARALAHAVRVSCEGLGRPPAMAFLFSDEASLVFLDEGPFGGRVEKLCSVLASAAAGHLSLALDVPVAFDARAVLLTPEGVGDYLRWRQREAWNNHLCAHAFWALRRDGLGAGEAAARLKGMRNAGMHELLFRHGVNAAKTPAWQRNGVLLVRRGGSYDELWEPPRLATAEGRRWLEALLVQASPGEAAEDREGEGPDDSGDDGGGGG